MAQGFIIDLQTRERLNFQSDPNIIQPSGTPKRGSNFAAGGSHGTEQWTNAGGRTYTFPLVFWWESGPLEAVYRKYLWLDSLRFPSRAPDGKSLLPAPTVLVQIGQVLKGNFLVDDVSNVQLTNLQAVSLLPRRITLTLKITEVYDGVQTKQQVRTLV